MRFLFRFMLIFVLLFSVGTLSAQDRKDKIKKPPTVEQQKKNLAKKKKSEGKQVDKETKKALKRHKKIQSKDTRKSMKKNLKRTQRNRKNKKESFFVRLFRKK